MRELSIKEVNEVSGGWVWSPWGYTSSASWVSAGVVSTPWATVAWNSGAVVNSAVVVNTPNAFVIWR
ncbi:MAG: hypothetical protein KAH20_14155 [Methylococcales bacterium]|nr:hypothetical protein [Methylococcales bacterium]